MISLWNSLARRLETRMFPYVCKSFDVSIVSCHTIERVKGISGESTHEFALTIESQPSSKSPLLNASITLWPSD